MARLQSLVPSAALLILLLSQLTGCVHGRREGAPELARPTRPAAEQPAAVLPTPPPSRAAPAPRSSFEGVASFYGRWHAGRRTASGVPFRPEGLTCAHRTLKFGTRLRVTNLENGRTTHVVVNDRGPFVRGRVLDLSLGAAKQLAMVRRGKARVRVHILP